MTPHNRRATDVMDPLQDQIESLILEAKDPKDKAFLLILNKIAMSLDMNTVLTQKLGADLEKHTEAFSLHETRELELINQGKGTWRAAVVSILIIQGMLVWWGSNFLSDNKVLNDQVAVLKTDIEKHKEHHRLEESYRGGPKVEAP